MRVVPGKSPRGHERVLFAPSPRVQRENALEGLFDVSFDIDIVGVDFSVDIHIILAQDEKASFLMRHERKQFGRDLQAGGRSWCVAV